MAKGEDTELFHLKYTSPENLIGIVLEQVWVIPEIMLELSGESVLILIRPSRRCLLCYKPIDNISKPGLPQDSKQLLIQKVFINGNVG